MKKITIIMAILAGSLCLAYDVWLIQSGRFHAGVMLGLVIWMGILVVACSDSRRKRFAELLAFLKLSRRSGAAE